MTPRETSLSMKADVGFAVGVTGLHVTKDRDPEWPPRRMQGCGSGRNTEAGCTEKRAETVSSLAALEAKDGVCVGGGVEVPCPCPVSGKYLQGTASMRQGRQASVCGQLRAKALSRGPGKVASENQTEDFPGSPLVRTPGFYC